jgi:type II secretory pathway component GspD/PulD (secretin)
MAAAAGAGTGAKKLPFTCGLLEDGELNSAVIDWKKMPNTRNVDGCDLADLWEKVCAEEDSDHVIFDRNLIRETIVVVARRERDFRRILRRIDTVPNSVAVRNYILSERLSCHREMYEIIIYMMGDNGDSDTSDSDTSDSDDE